MRRVGQLLAVLCVVALVMTVCGCGGSGSPTVPSVSTAQAGGTWETKAPMPLARSGPAAGVINGVLYVAGGHSASSDTPSLQAYDVAADTWSILADMPGPRYQGCGAGVIDGQLYVAGGWTKSPPLPNRNLWVYDPLTNTWNTRADMLRLAAYGVTGVIDGKLYVHSGTDGYSGYHSFLHVYDPVTNQWAVLPPSPHVQACEPAGGVIDGKFYVAGGVDAPGNLLATLNVYDPATNTWTTKAPMPTARGGGAAGVIDGKLYVVGGYDGAAVLSTLEVYDPVTDTWTTDTPMPTPRRVLAVGVINGVLYAVGGPGPLATVEAFTPAPSVLEVAIDIKPGSFPNPINLKAKGKVTVAILSTPDFDATTVDPSTVRFAGASVATQGRGALMVSSEDVNSDGRLDLVLHFETQALDPAQLAGGSGCLTGQTLGGQPIQGSDEVVIVPPE